MKQAFIITYYNSFSDNEKKEVVVIAGLKNVALTIFEKKYGKAYIDQIRRVDYVC